MEIGNTEYIAYGFDVDHCLVRYKHKELKKLIYDSQVRCLVNDRGYDPDIFKINENDFDFIQNFLTIDLKNGNLLKLGPNKKIIRCYHGFKKLSNLDIQEIYGPECIFEIFEENNLKLLPHYVVTSTHFEDVHILMYAKIIDSLYTHKLEKSFTEIWDDIHYCVKEQYIHYKQDSYTPLQEHGYFFKQLMENTERYIYEQKELKTILQNLKKEGKFIFAVSNSHLEFAEHTLTAVFGTDWQDLFDIVCLKAQKPNFFTQDNPFWDINLTLQTTKQNSYQQLDSDLVKKNKVFQEGSAKILDQYIRLVTGHTNDDQVAFFGDNWVTDAYAAQQFGWHGVCVIEELQELEFGSIENCHYYQRYWGDFCKDTDIHDDTIEVQNYWLTWIKQNSLQTCSLVHKFTHFEKHQK